MRLLDVAVVVPCGNVQHLKKVVFTNDISVWVAKGRGETLRGAWEGDCHVC